MANISKIYNGNTILDNIALTIEDNDRIGLVGINGSGKSTLLRLITGEEEYETQTYPIEPVLSLSSNVRIGILKQNAGLDGNRTVYDEAMSAFTRLLAVKSQMDKLHAELLLPDVIQNEKYFSELSHNISDLESFFRLNDGYIMDVNIDIVLGGMGFPKESYGRLVSTLSGGEKTRLALSKLLLEKPDLLILDEPTNHLDMTTVVWLENFLSEYKKALLIVSHDRYFLDRLTTSICELERGHIKRYKGNYTRFTELKKEANIRQLKEYEEQQREIADLEDFVARNLVRASTTKRAQSRRKKLESLEIIEKPVMYEKSSKIDFEYDMEPPVDVLKVKRIDIAAGSGDKRKVLAENVSFELRRGEKLAVVGANGTGKTTLLKMLTKKLPCFNGVIEWARNTRISYFDQENSQLHRNLTVMDEIHTRYPTMTDLQIRSLLGKVRLTGENVFKPVSVISGGERAKLCFAIMNLERGNVLILDEPTNHLDISTREVLEDALCAYTGTIIFVSHDRYLLSKLATRVCEITPDGVRFFEGGFSEYQSSLLLAESGALEAERKQREETEREVYAEKKTTAYRSKEQRAKDAQNRQLQQRLEAEIEELHKRAEILQLQIASNSPDNPIDYETLTAKCEEINALKAEADEKTDEWLLICEELEGK
jgi:ATP-binding cassette subfamily F protein 3